MRKTKTGRPRLPGTKRQRFEVRRRYSFGEDIEQIGLATGLPLFLVDCIIHGLTVEGGERKLCGRLYSKGHSMLGISLVTGLSVDDVRRVLIGRGDIREDVTLSPRQQELRRKQIVRDVREGLRRRIADPDIMYALGINREELLEAKKAIAARRLPGTPKARRQARQMAQEGYSAPQIAHQLGWVSIDDVERVIKRPTVKDIGDPRLVHRRRMVAMLRRGKTLAQVGQKYGMKAKEVSTFIKQVGEEYGIKT